MEKERNMRKRKEVEHNRKLLRVQTGENEPRRCHCTGCQLRTHIFKITITRHSRTGESGIRHSVTAKEVKIFKEHHPGSNQGSLIQSLKNSVVWRVGVSPVDLLSTLSMAYKQRLGLVYDSTTSPTPCLGGLVGPTGPPELLESHSMVHQKHNIVGGYTDAVPCSEIAFTYVSEFTNLGQPRSVSNSLFYFRPDPIVPIRMNTLPPRVAPPLCCCVRIIMHSIGTHSLHYYKLSRVRLARVWRCAGWRGRDTDIYSGANCPNNALEFDYL
ncbi:hypothetical protein J6590_001882 [Homalodisca vitripennis]|nr:hypothetical protein J6590_001882 [Homalodisca vitripennis]